MLEVLLDTFLESLLTLPFLLAAYLLLEYVEHKAGDKLTAFLGRSNRWSVPLGAVTGLVPQCGFSVASANLYAGGLISLGTLAAVFFATSDEAFLVLLAHPESIGVLLKLLVVKVLAAILAGYGLDLLTRKKEKTDLHIHEDLCAHCGCDDEHGIFLPALKHTLSIYAFILVVSLVMNVLLYTIGEERLHSLMLTGSTAQVFIAPLIGFIPNCAASVVLTELFLTGSLSFGALTAGLCTSAGLGIVVLFRTNKHIKENLMILGYLYIAAVIIGLIVQVIPGL